jgi:hypothetical protein
MLGPQVCLGDERVSLTSIVRIHAKVHVLIANSPVLECLVTGRTDSGSLCVSAIQMRPLDWHPARSYLRY